MHLFSHFKSLFINKKKSPLERLLFIIKNCTVSDMLEVLCILPTIHIALNLVFLFVK